MKKFFKVLGVVTIIGGVVLFIRNKLKKVDEYSVNDEYLDDEEDDDFYYDEDDIFDDEDSLTGDESSSYTDTSFYEEFGVTVEEAITQIIKGTEYTRAELVILKPSLLSVIYSNFLKSN